MKTFLYFIHMSNTNPQCLHRLTRPWWSIKKVLQPIIVRNEIVTAHVGFESDSVYTEYNMFKCLSKHVLYWEEKNIPGFSFGIFLFFMGLLNLTEQFKCLVSDMRWPLPPAKQKDKDLTLSFFLVTINKIIVSKIWLCSFFLYFYLSMCKILRLSKNFLLHELF